MTTTAEVLQSMNAVAVRYVRPVYADQRECSHAWQPSFVTRVCGTAPGEPWAALPASKVCAKCGLAERIA